MFGSLNLTRPQQPASHLAAAAPALSYNGPERRTGRAWLAATLDEVDFGMLLLTDTDHVVHANHAARIELDGEHPLQMFGQVLRARHSHDVPALHDALHNAAHRALRKLVTLGEGARRVSVSVVPIGDAQRPGDGATLLMMSKRQTCESLSVQGYARSHGLTGAETRVLMLLCLGYAPADVAAKLGVGIATVRTQIGSIQLKTSTDSIRALVQQVAGLPPLMSVLRQALPRHAAADFSDAPMAMG